MTRTTRTTALQDAMDARLQVAVLDHVFERQRKFVRLESLLRHGGNPNAPDDGGHTPCWHISRGNGEASDTVNGRHYLMRMRSVARVLLASGANPLQGDGAFAACLENSKQSPVVFFWLDLLGAPGIEIRDAQGGNPYHVMAEHGHAYLLSQALIYQTSHGQPILLPECLQRPYAVAHLKLLNHEHLRHEWMGQPRESDGATPLHLLFRAIDREPLINDLDPASGSVLATKVFVEALTRLRRAWMATAVWIKLGGDLLARNHEGVALGELILQVDQRWHERASGLALNTQLLQAGLRDRWEADTRAQLCAILEGARLEAGTAPVMIPATRGPRL